MSPLLFRRGSFVQIIVFVVTGTAPDLRRGRSRTGFSVVKGHHKVICQAFTLYAVIIDIVAKP